MPPLVSFRIASWISVTVLTNKAYTGGEMLTKENHRDS